MRSIRLGFFSPTGKTSGAKSTIKKRGLVQC